MMRVQGDAGVRLLECTNPVKGKWRVRWDVQKREDGSTDYMEEEFDHRPSDEEIKETVINWYNNQTDRAILSGFSYEGNTVWLSTENQFNYKAAYDLARQSNGATLPVKFKFGSDEKPVYRVFENIEDLTDFYTKAMRYILETLDAGWKKKDAFDLEQYQIE
ncbi:DUF4376 domain-containing protein [Prevotella intermedia]|uniref:DUF4376 domain-containing protein n=1 Tax=Prevotella intermedia TaxID=28131 RepID=A0A2M8TUU7_PREIN|nr:hypothetical protein [Prevotella intermedia]PJI27723.1 hypothetical protein CTM58_06215 [Prevotella intermedia]